MREILGAAPEDALERERHDELLRRELDEALLVAERHVDLDDLLLFRDRARDAERRRFIDVVRKRVRKDEEQEARVAFVRADRIADAARFEAHGRRGLADLVDGCEVALLFQPRYELVAERRLLCHTAMIHRHDDGRVARFASRLR